MLIVFVYIIFYHTVHKFINKYVKILQPNYFHNTVKDYYETSIQNSHAQYVSDYMAE